MHDHVVRATTEPGTVEGFTRGGVNRWRSFPYARPPVGRLRLRAPQPVEPWATVTTDDGRTGVGWVEWNRNQH